MKTMALIFIKSVLFLLCLGVVVLFGGLTVTVPSLMFMVIPFGLSITTNLINYFVASFCALVPGLLELVLGMRVRICGDLKKLQGPCLIIMNHRTRLDWMFFWCYLVRMGYLPNLKIMLKAGLKSVPIAGWAMQTALYFFVSRKWKVDEKCIRTRLQYFRETNFPLQFLLFPEGTDLSPSNKAKSDRYAHDNGFQTYNYVLHPKFKGFCTCVEEMRKGEASMTVVNMSVGYIGNMAQNETDFALGTWPSEIHFFAKQYPSSGLPSDTDCLVDWLEQRWAEKENQLEDFYTNGKFSAEYLPHSKRMQGMNFAVKCMAMWVIFIMVVGYYLSTGWWFWIYYLVVATMCFLIDKYTPGLDALILERYRLFK